MTDDFLQVKNLSHEQVAALENEYQNLLLSTPTDSEKVWQALRSFFSDKNSQVDWQYRQSYWRWYTDLTWRRLGRLDDDAFLNTAIKRQVPMALTMGFDVWNDLMFRLNDLIDPQLVKNAYEKIRSTFLESEAVVGADSSVVYTVADLVKKLKASNQPGSDSLSSAEGLATVKRVFQGANKEYGIESVEVVFDRFVGLVNFFLGVEPEDAWFIVDAYVNPEKYEKTEAGAPGNVPENNNTNTNIATTESTVEVNQVNYTDIKSMIEARFTRDGSGEFTNLDGVLALLDSLAADQGDDQIRELYYFDEGAGKFQWNEALLT